jgi:adhesin transport system outer membrane protein
LVAELALTSSPVSLSGAVDETVAESELRQKFLSAARITWRISPARHAERRHVALTTVAFYPATKLFGRRTGADIQLWPALPFRLSAQQAAQAQREELAMQVSNALIEWNKQQRIIAISLRRFSVISTSRARDSAFSR